MIVKARGLWDNRMLYIGNILAADSLISSSYSQSISMHPVFEEVLTTGKVYDEHGNLHDALSIGASRAQCEILQRFVHETNAQVTLETGLAFLEF